MADEPRSCSCDTARRSGAARAGTRRSATSRSPPAGASRRAALATRLVGREFAAGAHRAPASGRIETCAFAGSRDQVESPTISPSGTTASTRVARPPRSARRSPTGRSSRTACPGGETARGGGASAPTACIATRRRRRRRRSRSSRTGTSSACSARGGSASTPSTVVCSGSTPRRSASSATSARSACSAPGTA